MKLTDFNPLHWITHEMMITSIDKKEQTMTIVDQSNEYLIDMHVGAFETFVRAKRLLEKETIERHFVYEWPVTIVEPISFSQWLEETTEKEIAQYVAEYYLKIGHKNMTEELSKALKTSKLIDL